MAAVFELCTSSMITGKLAHDAPLWKWAQYNRSFKPTRVNMADHAEIIRRGYATCPVVNGNREQGNFVSAQHIGLDFDTKDEYSSLDYLAADPFISEYGGLLHTTSSHTPQEPRGRLMLYLDQPVTDPDEYRRNVLALLNMFTLVDQSANDPARLFFGAVGCQVVMLNRVLPVELLKSMVLPEVEPAPAIELPIDVLGAIASALGAQRTGNNEWSQLIKCPYHDDHDPSANWNFDGHFLHCFKCGDFLAKQVAAKLGIAWTGHPIVVTNRLPNSAREYLLKDQPTAYARVLESLYSHGLGEQTLTANDIMAVVSAHKSTVLGLMHWIGDLVENRAGYIFNDSFKDSSLIYSNDSTSDHKPPPLSCIMANRELNSITRGRKALTITLPTPERLCQLLGIEPSGSDKLPPEALLSNKAYRQAVHIALLERRPGTYTNKWLRERIGIKSRRTLRNYEQPYQQSGNLIKEINTVVVKELDSASHLPNNPSAYFIESGDRKFAATLIGLDRALAFNPDGTAYLKRTIGSVYAWQDSTAIELPADS